jgi:hypothetical protein
VNKAMDIQDLNQQNALSKTHQNTNRKTHFILSANFYMFHYQGAILRGFNNNKKDLGTIS